MLELVPENTLAYLRQGGWLHPNEPAHIEALGWGVSNIVLRVQTPDRLFILKQSRPQLRTKATWFSDINRVYREQEVMEALHPLLPADTVPAVLFADRANYVFAMSHAPLDARVWKETLLRGEVDLTLGERAGTILGQIHEQTACARGLVEKFRDRTVFVQLRIDPFYRRIQERWPELKDLITPLIDTMMSSAEALCHGDYSPKNILAHDQGFTLVDYETAHLGDPAMDLGFFLSHLLLKAIKRPGEREAFHELTRAFWRGYQRELHTLSFAQLQQRGVPHLGVCLLARIDGTSPVDYLTEASQRAQARSLGRSLLLQPPTDWEAVLTRMQ